MKKQVFKSESSLYVNFKRTMYAIMVLFITIAVPLLSYMELSHVDDSANQKNIKIEKSTEISTEKENTVKI